MNATNSIAAVAARIQERAYQLSSERTRLQQTQLELEEIQKLYQTEIDKNAQVRREMLTTVRMRNGIELDSVMKIQEEIINYEQKLDNAEEEYNDAEMKLQKLENIWEKMEVNVYADHEVKLELYKRKIEGKIERRKARKKRREDRLNELIKTSLDADKNATLLHREIANAREEIRRLDLSEEREDEEISALAMNIRATVAKVSSYVSSLPRADV